MHDNADDDSQATVSVCAISSDGEDGQLAALQSAQQVSRLATWFGLFGQLSRHTSSITFRVLNRPCYRFAHWISIAALGLVHVDTTKFSFCEPTKS